MRIVSQALQEIETGKRAGQALAFTVVDNNGAEAWGFYAMRLWVGGSRLMAPHKVYATRIERNQAAEAYLKGGAQ